MAGKLPLRTKLAFWYGTIVAVTLLAYGFYTYISVYTELHKNLDVSISKVLNSLDFVISRKPENIRDIKFKQNIRSTHDKFALLRELEEMRFVGPIRPTVQREKLVEEDLGEIWSAVFEHILLNPKNFFVQIADTNNNIIWRSQNLQNDTLPTLLGFSTISHMDTIYVPSRFKDSVIQLAMEVPKTIRIDSILTTTKVMGTDIRLLIKRTNQAVISVGYVLNDLRGTLKKLFIIQIVALPFILLISIIGGWIMSSVSLKPIDIITQTADEITAKNLSRRLPEIPTNDEVGHLTRTLNNMIERLEEAFNQVKKFAADASHELRTPLTILQGELEIALHSKKTPEEYEEILVSALEEVGRLSSVVESILELSKAETGQIKINLKVENLSKIAEEVAEDISLIAEQKKIRIEKNIEPNIFIPLDAPRIHQALLNLLDNATKYTKEGGTIKLNVQKDTDLAILVVEDNGIGIPKEDLNNIFNRMYRASKGIKSGVKGYGLGLSIVKWIVEAHNGTIEVESEVNKYTRFTVKLPTKQENEE
ncbi:MAG: ATP-binding protein [Ignavibacteria bacterium]|nr:ATP-binding protein [Ignavibacteria bacterium]